MQTTTLQPLATLEKIKKYIFINLVTQFLKICLPGIKIFWHISGSR
jgi:hypothetical protein